MVFCIKSVCNNLVVIAIVVVLVVRKKTGQQGLEWTESVLIDRILVRKYINH